MHLEEYLYIPTLSIDPDDFILISRCVGTYSSAKFEIIS